MNMKAQYEKLLKDAKAALDEAGTKIGEGKIDEAKALQEKAKGLREQALVVKAQLDALSALESDEKDAKIAEDTRKYIITRDFDKIANAYFEKKGSKHSIRPDEINAFIKKQPDEERNRLRQRYSRIRKLWNVPNRRWWLMLQDISPEERAIQYWARRKVAKPKEIIMLEENLRKIPGINSPRFRNKLRELKKGK